jgi:uncharacterized damage-inducible protein DinB
MEPTSPARRLALALYQPWAGQAAHLEIVEWLLIPTDRQLNLDMETLLMSHQLEPIMIEFFQYNHWANQVLMGICINLSDEIITTSIPGSYGSIRETFIHILKAETSFLKRIDGAYPEPDFKWEDNPSLSQMVSYEASLSEALLDTLQRVPATQNVHEVGNGWTFDYQARLIFMSVVYHGIAHRTDITTLLNNLGVSLPELDVWGYQSAYPERFQSKVFKIGQ